MPSASSPSRTLGEEFGGGRGQRFRDAGRVGDEPSIALVLRVEDAQRVPRQPEPAVVRQLLPAGLEVVDQAFAVGGAAVAVAEGVELQRAGPADVQLVEDVGRELDDLDVCLRSGDADDLDIDLMELALAALLRALVAKYRPAREELERRVLAQPAGNERPRHAGGEFGP